jgi:Helix-turn-helix domain
VARRYPRDPEATTVAYTLGQAARAADVSKTTIQRAIKSGRLSASRQQDGSYVIDPSELHRAFPRDGNANGEMKQSVTGNATGELRISLDRRVSASFSKGSKRWTNW